jgi:hypothetical protein
VAVAAALTVALPAVAIAASSPVAGPALAVFRDDVDNYVLTAIEDDLVPTATRTGQGVEVGWTGGGPWRTDVFYVVFRADAAESELECEHSDGATAMYCYVRGVPIGTTRDTSFLDAAPTERPAYRIGVATNWLDDETQGDVFAFSRPVTPEP